MFDFAGCLCFFFHYFSLFLFYACNTYLRAPTVTISAGEKGLHAHHAVCAPRQAARRLAACLQAAGRARVHSPHAEIRRVPESPRYLEQIVDFFFYGRLKVVQTHLQMGNMFFIFVCYGNDAWDRFV
jgi:hypothetical protein